MIFFIFRQPNQTRVDTSEGEDDDGHHHHHHHHHHGITRQSSIKTQTKNNPHLSVVNDINATNFHFDVSHFFLLGSPLPIVLAYRQNLGKLEKYSLQQNKNNGILITFRLIF